MTDTRYAPKFTRRSMSSIAFARNITLTLGAVLLISGCSSTPPQSSSKIEKWKAQTQSPEFKAEKETYQKRLGAEICWETGVADFLKNPQLKPSKECVYPASKMIVESEDEEATFLKGKRDLKQSINQLKVLQVTSNGFVIEAPKDNSYRLNSNVIFIERTDEAELVDGSYLDDRHDWNLYEYTGPFTYQTKLGSKTVHSFKKVSWEKLLKASEGLKSYGPRRELFTKNELWDRMEELEKEKK